MFSGRSLANHIVKKHLGKYMLYPSAFKNPNLAEEVERDFEEEKSYKKPQTIYMANRNLAQLKPCKWRRKYWSDTKRHYDQKQIGFFVSQVLARRKIAIPLR